ncbi:MAG TPA: PKD domain-containing protein, partial [Gemmatimonadaceae bacterium]|nr:PKD domain-containing protein [Gemmatimonadaceae bacterium]
MGRRRRRRSVFHRASRDGFTLLAILAVLVVALLIASAVVLRSSVSVGDRKRLDVARTFFGNITTATSGIPLFEADIGDPPGRLSDLSFPITTARFDLCGKSYTAGDVGSWSGRYAEREYPATGIPVGVGIASDTLGYEEVGGTPRAVVIIRSTPLQDAMRLDAAVDTLAGASGNAAGLVRWNTPDASGLVTLRWSSVLPKKCAGGNQNPIAAFTFTCTSFTCIFTDGSSDPDGTVTAWSWSFGDATTSALQNPTKVYAAAGTYTVTLTVNDNSLGEGSVSQSVSVSNIVLSGVGRRQGPNRFADLTWSGATTAN